MGMELTGLDKKVAVVTGAGRLRSIGRSIALELARAGCDVAITGTGRDPATFPDDEKAVEWRDIESVAEEIRGLGRRALPVVSDVSELGSVEALAERVEGELGRVDFVVNNAGAARGGDRVAIVEIDPASWRRVIDVNLNGSFYMSQIFGRRLIDRGEGGAIVNISSIGGKMMPPNNAAYAASKAGLHALTAAMSGEVGVHGIRVNAICPGIIETSRMDDIPRGPVWDEMIAAHVPLGRCGTPEEIGYMTVYLCSDQGAWITGQLYSVDGGQVAGR
ncbi:MAG: SDR family oxidoreductase [Deltaproteobacteria bacterium]|nr:SDR family oxidoreductase [Deltaproteobacteria bacterium]